MFIECASEYDIVVQVNEINTVEHFAEHDIIKRMTVAGAVVSPNGINCVLNESERQTESGFHSIVRMYFDLMVFHCQVERRKLLGTSESVDNVLEARQRMCVFFVTALSLL